MTLNREIQSIWEYEVRKQFISQFVDAYGHEGDWVKLFRKCPGYIKTELKRDIENPNRFLTFDFWQSYSAFSSIKRVIRAEYEALDNRCDDYTLSENHIGVFEMTESEESST